MIDDMGLEMVRPVRHAPQQLGSAVDDGMIPQRTLQASVQCTGIGTHSGSPVSIALHPAPIGHGIVFRRTDVAPGTGDLPARWDHVVDGGLNTTLGNAHGTRLSTIEHLMAALIGCGIDNALITVDGPELPIMDGSAAPFVFLLECAGAVEQDAPRRVLRVLAPIELRDGARVATLLPEDACVIDAEIQFAHPRIGQQRVAFALGGDRFKLELCRARTFGFLGEVDRLRAMGLARGSSLDNAVVLDSERVVNPEGLRYRDEFVRHKALDCLGDLFLAGGVVLGRYRGVRPGHALTHALLRRLFATDDAWRWEDACAMRQFSFAAA